MTKTVAEVLLDLIPAIEEIHHECEKCIFTFVTNANQCLSDNDVPFSYGVDHSNERVFLYDHVMDRPVE